MIGPFVGQGFIAAVNLYAEVSGVGGGPAALPWIISKSGVDVRQTSIRR